VAVAVGFGAYFYKQSAETEVTGPGGGRPGGGGPGGGPRVRTVTVDAVTAERGSINERLLLTGALKPKELVNVTPKSTGRVQVIHQHIGDPVKVGDLIAELELDEIEQQVNRAEAAIQVSKASVAQRKAELANVEAQLGRADKLSDDGLISPQDFETLKTQSEVVRAQVTLAEAQMEQASAELRELTIRLEQTRIYAPIDGIVALRYVDVGALLGPSTPIVQIVNLQTMVTAANVPEREVGKLRVGNRAVVHVDSFGDRGFNGRVARISPVLDAATRSASIEIEIANPGNLLKAEMFARVELDLASTREAVLLPREALVYRGSQPGVYLIKNDRPEFRPIETGLTEQGKIEVLANLAPGTEVVGRGSTMIAEGDRIRVSGVPETRADQTPVAALEPAT
jgi:RND family efflux transporter MFP subunit